MTGSSALHPLLSGIQSPADLRALPEGQLALVCAELRDFLIRSVATRGGHFAAGLGTVELTVALHYVFNTPEDRLVWDVGHQAYPHKVLTGRRDRLHTIKQKDGLAPFPARSESPYDTFGVGHSSTSISAALGMAVAAQRQGTDRRAVAIIGDGAITAGSIDQRTKRNEFLASTRSYTNFVLRLQFNKCEGRVGDLEHPGRGSGGVVQQEVGVLLAAEGGDPRIQPEVAGSDSGGLFRRDLRDR